MPATEGEATLLFPTGDVESLDDASRKVLGFNQQMHAQNRAPRDFPLFVRKGFDMLIFADGYEKVSSGLIFKEFSAGDGRTGVDGDQLTFHYTAYNEEGAFIDSSYKQRRPAQTRLGIQGMIPGFELALRDMKPGSRRRVIVPPDLGPPVGPSTFFSAKQYEVFDVELLDVKTCVRKGFGMVSTVECS